MGPLVSFLVGVALPLLMGITTDQIWQKVYDSSNTAIRVNQVAGGGTPTGCTTASGILTCTGFKASESGSYAAQFGNTGFVWYLATGGLGFVADDYSDIWFGFAGTDMGGNMVVNAGNGTTTPISASFGVLNEAGAQTAIGATQSGNGGDSGHSYSTPNVGYLYTNVASGLQFEAPSYRFWGNVATTIDGDVTIGKASSNTGSLGLKGTTSGTVTVAVQDAAGTYNFNLPAAAGTAGQALLSGGGGGAAQTYGTLGVAAGGTNLTAATDDNTMVGNGTTWQTKAIPDCPDTGGNHLNYTASTNTFSCGTS